MKVTQSFQAEIQQLLNLMIHSLYSHREIFLRELISNASDAIDKLKFQALTHENLVPSGTEYAIRLEPNSTEKTLKIIDNGIGMDREEVLKNLGTIAHSGTKAFLAQAQELKNKPELIGQFGVGFYSAFMVAEKVVVHTQKAGTENGVVWESTGDGQFSIDEVPRPEGFGTTITLKLKALPEDTEDESLQDFTDTWTLKGLVKKYSDFISYPIKMKTEKQVPKKEGQEGEFETEIADDTLNSQKALWLKSPSEVKEDEYKEFYRHLSHDWSDPLKTIHFKAEGTMEYSAMMFIPSQKPFNYYYRDTEYGLSLYIKRVFIMADNKNLLPSYLRFVKGLVDSSDLSLNVSREMLQQDRQVGAIRKSLTSKVLNTLKDFIAADRTQYENFWTNFGPTLKEGVTMDSGNKDKLVDLFLFHSTHSDKMTTLAEYVERMKSEQKNIYFITGESLDQIRTSPYLEKLKDKGYEVLLMVDPVDEWVAESVREYKEKSLQSVVKENLDIDTEEEKKAKEEENKKFAESHKELIENLKSALSEQVRDVKISDRLTSTPVCLVSGSNDPTAHMEKILSQINKDGSPSSKSKRIMEINPKHPLFDKMVKLPADTQKKWAHILYSQALLTEGSNLPDPVHFSQQIAELMLATPIH